MKLQHAAHWASWADSMKMIAERHPEVARVIIRGIDAQHNAPSTQAIVANWQSLEVAGMHVPSKGGLVHWCCRPTGR